MADPIVKAEPTDSPGPGQAPADEEDLYEDAGDLEFYDPNAESNRYEALYLARVPKYLWEAWAKLLDGLGDNDEVRLGTMRTWPVTNAKGGEEVSQNALHVPTIDHI
jgi:transcription initiation factor TFIIF subunit beta